MVNTRCINIDDNFDQQMGELELESLKKMRVLTTAKPEPTQRSQVWEYAST